MIGQTDTHPQLATYAAVRAAAPEKRREPTMELDGDTEFERIIMSIPADTAHMVKIVHVFNRHLENLKFANVRAYNGIIEQLREIVKT